MSAKFDSERSNRVIPFKGTKDSWRSWPVKFKARGRRRGYAKLLSGAAKIPTQAEIELAELGTSEEDQKILELAELNELAYEDMLLSIDTDTKAGQVAFDLVKNAKTADHPEGNSYLAYKKLENKYDPKNRPIIYFQEERVYQFQAGDL